MTHYPEHREEYSYPAPSLELPTSPDKTDWGVWLKSGGIKRGDFSNDYAP